MWQRIICATTAFALFGLVGAAPAHADGPPVVSLAGANPLTVHLNSVNGRFTAIFDLNIENNGDALSSSQYEVSLVANRIYSAAQLPTLEVQTPTDLQARTVTPVPVELTVKDSDTTTLAVVLSVSTNGILPSTQTLTLTRSELSINFIGILVASLALGLIVFLLLLFLPRGKWQSKKGGGDGSILWTPSSFTFSGSWLTSVSGVLTAVGTVFTTTGVLTSLIPGIDTSFFLAVTVAYGVTLTIPALVYSAFMKMPSDSSNGVSYGTRRAYLGAALFTAIAVGGLLSTVGAVIWLSGLSRDVRLGVECFLGAVAAIQVVYIITNAGQLANLKNPKDAAPASLWSASVSGTRAAETFLVPPGLP